MTPAVCVDIVRSVVTPKETLAGTDYQKIITLAKSTIVKDIFVRLFILKEIDYWNYLWIEPEWDPWYDDKHTRRNVNCEQVVRKFSFEK